MNNIIVLAQERTNDAEDTRFVYLQASTTPATFPTTGEGVTGLPDYCKIAPGSQMRVLNPSAVYFLDNDGETWKQWQPNA